MHRSDVRSTRQLRRPQLGPLLALGWSLLWTNAHAQPQAGSGAVHSGDVDIVQFIIDHGANVDAKAIQGATALINVISGKQAPSR